MHINIANLNNSPLQTTNTQKPAQKEAGCWATINRIVAPIFSALQGFLIGGTLGALVGTIGVVSYLNEQAQAALITGGKSLLPIMSARTAALGIAIPTLIAGALGALVGTVVYFSQDNNK